MNEINFVKDILEFLSLCTSIMYLLKFFCYSGVFNNCAAYLINFSENSNLHTLIKDLHIYLFLRITPTCTFITACTIIDIAKFLAQSLIFSSKLNNFQLVLPYSNLKFHWFLKFFKPVLLFQPPFMQVLKLFLPAHLLDIQKFSYLHNYSGLHIY